MIEVVGVSEQTEQAEQTNKIDFTKHLETRRWFILLSFSLFSATSAMLWTTYSPISTAAQEYYDASVDDIIQFSNSYMFIYFAGSFLGAWLSYKWFTKSILVAMAINTLGGWVRYAGGQNYGVTLFGQYIAAAAQNVILFVPVMIGDRWFPAKERTWAVTIASFANLFGWGFGFIFPTLLIGDGPHEISKVNLIEAIIATVPLLIGIISIRERPKVAPSASAQIKKEEGSHFWRDIKVTLKNKKFLAEMVCFGNLIGQSYTMSSVIVLFIPDASLVEQGLVGIVFIGSGIIAGLIATYLLSKMQTEKYDPVFRVFMVISFVGILVLAILIKQDDNMTSVYVLNAVLGIGVLGFQPFGAQAIVERTFPVQEVIPVNFMMVMAQLFGVIGNYIATANFVGDNGMWALVVLVSPCIIYITFFYRTETKRQQAETKWESAKTADNSPGTPIEAQSPVGPKCAKEDEKFDVEEKGE